jgi:hypothetical protein
MNGESRDWRREGWRLVALVLMMILSMDLLSLNAKAEETAVAGFESSVESPIASSVALLPSTRPASSSERLTNFALVYSAQWLVYGFTQGSTIGKHGSFRNWVEYPTQPHFDNDDYDFNIHKHSVSGASYYLFYRSRGYGMKDAFLWSFASSLAFEFTVETYTERPSYQDIYQTPVFGTLLGIGLETASRHLVASSSRFIRFFGYVLNPFALIANSDVHVSIRPTNSGEGYGPFVSVGF